MLRKKEVYTNITPIPSHIPRQLALDILHAHGEIITLNPLVLEYHPIKPPRDAEADEFYSTWYDITERIQYVPGLGRMGSGKINFRGCFHDMPWGLQTHIYAPAGVDLRNNWRVEGNQPGEPVQAKELGIGAPADGLYLREDIEIKCNITLVSFVKAQLKAASKVLVQRLLKKAELLDAGVLHAMMEDGKLKTFNPMDRTNTVDFSAASSSNTAGAPHYHHQVSSPTGGPTSPYLLPRLPHSPGYGPNSSPGFPPNGGMVYPPQQYQQQQQFQQTQYSKPLPHAPPIELPGDLYHPQASPNLLNPHPQYLRPDSSVSGFSENGPPAGRWSDHSRPSSYGSDTSGMKSPGPHQQGFATELPTMQESSEDQADALKRLEAGTGRQQNNGSLPPYNPQDYVNSPAYQKANKF